MNAILDWAARLSPAEAAWWLFVENLALFVLAVLAGGLAVRLFGHRPAAPGPEPLERREIVYATTTVILNWLVTLLGWYLWRHGLLVIRRDTGWSAWLDVL